jgi:mono/diheme cytochrome c family protein
MKRMAGLFGLAAILVAIAAQPGAAQASGTAVSKTIWDGVYTNAQADRGQRAAQQNCGTCHSPSEWSRTTLITAWAGRPIKEMHNHLQNTMPLDSPGRLTSQQYADILAYMLKLNNVPAGQSELPGDEAGLTAITVTRQGTR